MKSITIEKEGTKSELQAMLLKLKEQYEDELKSQNATVTQTEKGLRIFGEKKLFFKTFFVDAEIIPEDGSYTIIYDTNAPSMYVEKGISEIKKIITKL